MLNVYHQQLSGQVVRTKHAVNWLEFLKEERAKYPADQVVYIIQDGLSSHWTPEIRWWATAPRGAGPERHARELDEPGRDPCDGTSRSWRCPGPTSPPSPRWGRRWTRRWSIGTTSGSDGESGSATQCGRTDATRRESPFGFEPRRSNLLRSRSTSRLSPRQSLSPSGGPPAPRARRSAEDRCFRKAEAGGSNPPVSTSLRTHSVDGAPKAAESIWPGLLSRRPNAGCANPTPTG